MTTEAPPLLGHLDAGASRAAEELFRNAVPRIRTRLVNRVGSDLPVVCKGTEWSTVGAVLDKLSGKSAFATVRLEPNGLLGWVAVEHLLLTRLVGRILGQSLTTEDPVPRPPSRFDLEITKRIGEDVMGGLAEVLPAGSADRVRVVGAGNTAGVPGLPPTAFVGTTTYELGDPELPLGRFVVVLPSEVTRIAAPRKATRTQDENGLDRVLPLPVTVVAELGRLRMSLSEVRGLRVGATLDLGPVREVVVRVGERAAFLGDGGIRNSFRSVRVRDRVEGGVLRSS